MKLNLCNYAKYKESNHHHINSTATQQNFKTSHPLQKSISAVGLRERRDQHKKQKSQRRNEVSGGKKKTVFT